LWFAFLEVSAQRTDNKATKKPVLTNKYRLKKRGKPADGVNSKGSEKIQTERTVAAGFFRGRKRYTQAPKVMGQSQFKGSEPLYPKDKKTEAATFKSNTKLLPRNPKTGSSKFLSKTKYKPHQYRKGYDKFVSSYAYMPTEKREGHDKFISNTKYQPYKKRTGYDKFISNTKYEPYKKRTGYDKFVSNTKYEPYKKRTGYASFLSKTKYRPHEFRRGYDKFTGGTIKYSFLEKRKKSIIYNTRKQQNYKGNVRFVDWKKVRAKRSHRMATSLGALKIKYAPRKSKLSNRKIERYRAKPYNVRKLRAGKWMWKKNMPRYQRYKEKKPRYNPKEKQGKLLKNGLPLNAIPRVSPKFVKEKRKEKDKIQQEPKQD
jgi:hypothetical protein